MTTIVSYDPYGKKFHFDKSTRWVETLWATIYANNVSETAKIVFATVISHVYAEPLTFPSQRILAEACHKSTRTVIRAMNELKGLKLLEVPHGFTERQNNYIIYDHTHSDLKFSPEAEVMLKTLLDIHVSAFSVTSDKNTIGDKNVTILKEEEKEKEKEKKKSNIKEKEKERKEREEETSGDAGNEISLLSEREERQAKLNGSKIKYGPYSFLADEKRNLTEAMAEPKRKERIPKDVHQWKSPHFEAYFSQRYHQLVGKEMPVQFAQNRTLIKRMIERVADIEEIKGVIDFVFDNWEAVASLKGLDDGYPTVTLVFSRWFGTFQAMMHKGTPRSKKFSDNRADYEFKLTKPEKKEDCK